MVLEIALLALWIDTFLYGIHFLPSVILFNSGSILDGLAQKKFVFFLHCCSRKIGISTGIEVVLGALFNCGYDACFLMSFFFFFS